jgi:FecR protein
MRFRQIESTQGIILLMTALVVCSGSAWASSSTSCAYPRSGTGMGGTGTIARGTGIGGTGFSPEEKAGAMQLVGKVIFSQGPVEAQRDGNTRQLAQGDAVCVGETIVTWQSGTVRMRMADNAMITVSPLTQLKIEKYVYGGTSKDSSRLALLRGTGRFVTGDIGKAFPQNDLVQTPAATIGVRGTDHEATVILPNEKAGYPSGTYDKVNSGITFIRTEKGEVEIHPNQVGFSASVGELPTLLNELPGFYHANPSMRPEGSPSAAGESKDEGPGEDNKAREENEFDKPVETPASPSEHSDMPNGMEVPESPALPELPHIPENPEVPATPEHPELPVPPGRPDVPGQTDY